MPAPARTPPGALTTDAGAIRARTRPWRPLLEAGEAAAARAIAADVARRLRATGAVDAAVDKARHETGHPRSIHWLPEGVWQGYAGLAALWAIADECLPDCGWDVVGFDHLQLAVRATEQRPRPAFGISSGIAGLAFATWLLSRDGTRYRGLLSSLERTLADLVTAAATSLSARCPHGVATSSFDVISGLAGAGRYLLLRRDDPLCRPALEAVLRCLTSLSEESDGVPHWYTPPELVAAPARGAASAGNLNCGLAHGIPGPLALLSLAAREGVTVDGQHDAIARSAGWLALQRVDDEWGVNWPAFVPLGDAGRAAAPASPSRAAWCYGSPGVARALWLAGAALDEPHYRDLALEAIAAVHRRPLRARHIDSPTFCHGVAGLQQVTLRLAHDTGLPELVDAARGLHRQLVDAHEPDSVFGYRNLEPSGTRIDQPGLLDGAAGVALVLLAASTSVEPRWDAMLLLS